MRTEPRAQWGWGLLIATPAVLACLWILCWLAAFVRTERFIREQRAAIGSSVLPEPKE
jgi:hypothetical protein